MKAKADKTVQLKDKERRDKEIVDAAVKKKQKKKQKKKKKKGKKKAKVVTESGSEGEVQKISEATLAEEEKSTNGDGEKARTSKDEALRKLKAVCDGKLRATGPTVSTVEKRKWAPKLSSIVESGEEGTSRPSK